MNQTLVKGNVILIHQSLLKFWLRPLVLIYYLFIFLILDLPSNIMIHFYISNSLLADECTHLLILLFITMTI